LILFLHYHQIVIVKWQWDNVLKLFLFIQNHFGEINKLIKQINKDLVQIYLNQVIQLLFVGLVLGDNASFWNKQEQNSLIGAIIEQY
jgi:hypothetical protein